MKSEGMRRASSNAALSFLAADISRFRLSRHHLLANPKADAVTLCRDICGAQAQMMTPAYLQLWTRNHGLTRAEVEDALWKHRTLVRTSLMRQTIHLIPADEFCIYIPALKSCRTAGALRVMARCGIAREEAAELTDLILEILSSGPLGRTAIYTAVRPRVSKRVRAYMDKVWSIVRVPVAEGLICHGPGDAGETTFIRVDQWLTRDQGLKKQAEQLAEDEARRKLLLKYLGAYGPASLTDYAHWAGLPMAQVKPLRELVADEVVEINVDGNNCLLLRLDLKALRTAQADRGPDSVRLLPHFDPYLLAHRAKDHLLSARHYKLVYRNQGWISPVVLVNGSIAGTWSYERQATRTLIKIEPFQRLSRDVRGAVIKEAEGVAAFFASSLEIKFV